MKKILVLLALILGGAGLYMTLGNTVSDTAVTDEAALSGVIVEKPYAFATAPTQKNAAAFFVLHNHTSAGDRLISVSSDIAERTEMHTHSMDDGIMQMREVEGYDVPADDVVSFEPMGHHIMFMGLNDALTIGESFPLTLVFEQSGPQTVNVDIVAPGTKPDGGHAHDHHMHGH